RCAPRSRRRRAPAARSGGLLEYVHPARAGQADHVGEANLGALDLPVARLAAQVRGHLVDVGDPGRPERVPLGQQATGDVHGDLAVAPRAAPVDPLTRAALRAQPQVVIVTQLGGGEAVVQFDQVQILRVDARRLI